MLSRVPADSPQLEFDCFHEEVLPSRLALGNGALARDLAARLGPLGWQLPDGRGVTYVANEKGIAVYPGDRDATTLVGFDHDCWLSLVQDLETGPGLLYSRRGRVLRGDAMVFLAWESAWRAMYHGRPIFDPADEAALGLRNFDGGALDLERRFTLDSDLGEMAHFMKEAGFVVIRDVFSSDEIGAFWQASEELKDKAREADQKSWWGKRADGERVLTRVLDGSLHEAFKGLEDEPRLSRLVNRVEPQLVPALDGGDFVSVLYKNPDMLEGLSDLPWHRDCGMGGHAIMCPTINVSIFLSEANEATGPLKVLPGSHRGSVPAIDATHEKAPAGRFLDAMPGDVSFHYGDVMHAAPPPTGAGSLRRSAVVTFKPEDSQPHTGEQHYNDVLLEGSKDGQVAHLQTILERS